MRHFLFLSKFDHPHILKLLGVCLLNEPQYIILELMEGGDLLSYLRGARMQKVGTGCILATDDTPQISHPLPLFPTIKALSVQ